MRALYALARRTASRAASSFAGVRLIGEGDRAGDADGGLSTVRVIPPPSAAAIPRGVVPILSDADDPWARAEPGVSSLGYLRRARAVVKLRRPNEADERQYRYHDDPKWKQLLHGVRTISKG